MPAALWHRLQVAIARTLSAQQNSVLHAGGAGVVGTVAAAAGAELATAARAFWVRALASADEAKLSAAESTACVNAAMTAALGDSRSLVALGEFLACAPVQKAADNPLVEVARRFGAAHATSPAALTATVAYIEQNAAAFAAASSSSSAPLTAVALAHNARLAHLCYAFERQSTWQLGALAAELALPTPFDAERLVVRAAAVGLVGAKIDQVRDFKVCAGILRCFFSLLAYLFSSFSKPPAPLCSHCIRRPTRSLSSAPPRLRRRRRPPSTGRACARACTRGRSRLAPL